MVPISGPIAGPPESRPFLDSTSGFETTAEELQAPPPNAKTKHKHRLLSTHTTHLPKRDSVHLPPPARHRAILAKGMTDHPFWEQRSPLAAENPAQCPPVLGAQRLSTSAIRALACARNGYACALGGPQRGAPYVYDLLIRSARSDLRNLAARSRPFHQNHRCRRLLMLPASCTRRRRRTSNTARPSCMAIPEGDKPVLHRLHRHLP